MTRYKKVLSRRTMLQGAGTIAIGLPFLDAMRTTSVFAAAPEPPARAFNLFFGLGMPTPLQSEGFAGPMEPLQELQSKLLIVRGIDQVRCDFLCADGQVWFGEMTPYPLSGLGSFDSLEDEALMYGKWDLSRSWFMRSEHSGWRKLYAAAMRRSLSDSGTA